MAEHRFVNHLPDLIEPHEYDSDPDGRRVRFRIRIDETGVEVLGDAANPKGLEELLASLGQHTVIEQMLCG